MRINEYLSVCMLQLKVDLDCDSKNEFLIETSDVFKQMESAFSIIEKLKPDVAVFPEMTYIEKYESKYQELSDGRLLLQAVTIRTE